MENIDQRLAEDCPQLVVDEELETATPQAEKMVGRKPTRWLSNLHLKLSPGLRPLRWR